MKWVAICLAVLLTGVVSAQAPKTLKIAAAADLQPVMPAFAYAYEKETGIKLDVSFGSSSALSTQIVNGAPFDVFLGADYVFPEKVIAAGLAEEKLPVPYAQGTLVLWARKDSPLQPLRMEFLTDPRVTKIAIADEFHAPYGRAAYAALRVLKLEDRVKPKLVTAENISQTAQFVESGNAQLGFVSLTFANSAHGKQLGTYVMVPLVYPKITQCAVVIKNSPNLEEAKKFLAWIISSKIQGHLTEMGLTPVQ